MLDQKQMASERGDDESTIDEAGGPGAKKRKVRINDPKEA
jgi:hypothetical protein